MKNLAGYAAAILAFFCCSTTAWAQYDKDVFFMRGRQSIADGKYSQAIDNFNILAQLDTTDYWTFFFRGIAKYNLGDLRGAQTDFDTSVRLNPVFTSGYHYRAITLSRFGRYEEALSDLERAIMLRPGSTGLYFSRGVTYFLSQQFEKAVDDFNKYIRQEPKDPVAYLNRGASFLYMGDTLKALNDYNKAIKLDRFEPEGYIRRGRLYASSTDYEKAVKDMDKAIELDTTNTFAYFNRAIMLYEQKDYNSAMADLNRVLREEPGNALTLYNRGLINAQVGNFESALNDLDRVLNINPENVLAYFNRASIFIEMGRWKDALEDYDKAIELYPDFAKAYMNRSYVKNMLGDRKSSKEDYETAQKKVSEYRANTSSGAASFADTTQKYSSLLALDAEFAKKDFNDELLQHRDIDIRLRPLFRFVLSPDIEQVNYTLTHAYENQNLDTFKKKSKLLMTVADADSVLSPRLVKAMEKVLYEDNPRSANIDFLRSMYEEYGKQYNSALTYLDSAIDTADGSDGIQNTFGAFYRMNRAVLRAEMIDFISSIENNVQVLTMDDSRNIRARVKDQVSHQYDYSQAIDDLLEAVKMIPDFAFFYYDLGNLYCLSSELVPSIENYNKAIELHPYMGNAYFNRGLVLIYLKDKEKGCIDLSRAGELGIRDAYGVIKKFCEEEKE